MNDGSGIPEGILNYELRITSDECESNYELRMTSDECEYPCVVKCPGKRY